MYVFGVLHGPTTGDIPPFVLDLNLVLNYVQTGISYIRALICLYQPLNQEVWQGGSYIMMLS